MISELKPLLKYDPSTGSITWKGSGNSATIRLGSYLAVKHRGKYHLAHRLAWYLHYGKLPEQEIDHINNKKHDNSIKNLRDVSHSLNQHNRVKANKNSHTGILGVTKDTAGYRARITLNNKTISLGNFKTAEEAQEAYLKAKRELHKGNTL